MGRINEHSVVQINYIEGGTGATISCECQLSQLNLTKAEIATLVTFETQVIRAVLREALNENGNVQSD